MGRIPVRGIASVLLVTLLCVACGSSKKTTNAGGTPTGGATTEATAQPSKALGTGVTASTVKLGVALVDFNCIKPFVDGVRIQQQQTYQLYIDNINAHGGLAGHQIQPVYETYCPIGNAQVLALCTKFSEDEKVFAVVGTFVDFSGDAQTCVTKNHHIPVITFNLTKAIIDQSPPGLIVFPGPSPERIDTILVDLLQKQHTLSGKKLAVVGETNSQTVVTNSVVPALKKLNVPMGSTAILTSSSTGDTTVSQAQLDSFIERWKSEHVDALFLNGAYVTSQQYVKKIRAQMPNVTLITDDTDVLGMGQGQQKQGVRPNPYEGIISAAGPTAHQYDQSANWAYCRDIYVHETGKQPPNAETDQPKGPDGKIQDLYGVISDACQSLTLVQQIGNRAGKTLNADTWANAVNAYGSIRDVGGGPYNSIHMGKYDTFDSFQLEAFDSSLPPQGQWRTLTPLQNIPGS